MRTLSFRHAAATRSSDGSPLSGDLFAVDEADGSLGVMLVDVAGSGWDAGRDALRARARIDESVRRPPPEAMQDLHATMAGTRGAVGVAARFASSGEIRWVGVGDVRLRRWRRGVTSGFDIQRGQLGNSIPQLTELVGTVEPGDIYVFTTDGILSRISLEASGFERRSQPSVLAHRIVDTWHRAYDDAACLVVIADAA